MKSDMFEKEIFLDISIQDFISVMIFVVEPYIFSFLLLSEQFLLDRP